MFKFFKDHRDKTWKHLEENIQSKSFNKDKTFILDGKWKKFIRMEQGYKVFSVDANWIRTNLCIYFGHGAMVWCMNLYPWMKFG